MANIYHGFQVVEAVLALIGVGVIGLAIWLFPKIMKAWEDMDE